MIKELFNKTDAELRDEKELIDEEIQHILLDVPVGENDIELLKWDSKEESKNQDKIEEDKFLGVYYEG